MKDVMKILFALVLCLFICQTNVQGQRMFKRALDKVTGKIGDVANKAIAPISGKLSGKNSEAGSRTTTGPAKPEAPDVKNSVSELRAYTGLTKDAFLAKMKSMGCTETADEIGMACETCFKSKAGYVLGVKYGTRGKEFLVHEIAKGTVTKNPVLAKVKASYLDMGKQIIALKAKFSDGSLAGSRSSVNIRNESDYTSKFFPAFDNFVSSKDNGGCFLNYHENDYQYGINYMYVQPGQPTATIIVHIIDLTIEGQEG